MFRVKYSMPQRGNEELSSVGAFYVRVKVQGLKFKDVIKFKV